MVTSYRISDYFLAPTAEPRTYYDAQGVPILRLTVMAAQAGQVFIRQEKPDRTWQSDWLMRVETDGSLTEYGDRDENGLLIYVKDHEIRWSDSNGTVWPNLLRSDIKQWGSWGTYLCKPMFGINDDLDIYMEQKFRITERSVYHCQKDVGISAITYYLYNGESATITWRL